MFCKFYEIFSWQKMMNKLIYFCCCWSKIIMKLQNNSQKFVTSEFFKKNQLVYYYWIEYYPKSHISLLFLLIGKGKEDRPPMVSMMDEMQKTLARRRAKVERVEDVSRFLSSLLDNSPNYLVGYVIQKRNEKIKLKLWVYYILKIWQSL